MRAVESISARSWASTVHTETRTTAVAGREQPGTQSFVAGSLGSASQR